MTTAQGHGGVHLLYREYTVAIHALGKTLGEAGWHVLHHHHRVGKVGRQLGENQLQRFGATG